MDGIDGIQCHMTNTLNTPIEAIERDYPMRVTRYEFAEGTGGRGRYRGGNGLIRALTLTSGTARVSLLAERHAVAPRGARGGGDAACGKHALQRADGSHENIGAKASFAFAPEETIVVQTPGGGAYGVGDGATI
jgi:N-methylhydantoinase B